MEAWLYMLFLASEGVRLTALWASSIMWQLWVKTFKEEFKGNMGEKEKERQKINEYTVPKLRQE